MLANNIESNFQRAPAALHPLDAYDPELETWQQLFARRYPHHSPLLDALSKVESSNTPVYSKVAGAERGDDLVLGLFPNVRCSL